MYKKERIREAHKLCVALVVFMKSNGITRKMHFAFSNLEPSQLLSNEFWGQNFSMEHTLEFYFRTALVRLFMEHKYSEQMKLSRIVNN